MAYFENLVYRYEYDRAVREGHLVDYDVVAVRSNVRMNGVFLNEGEQIDQVDPETGTRQLDLLEDERTFDATEVERKITAPDSNRKILEELKAYADEHEREYGRFPKTLIFAANDLPHTSHADQLVDTGARHLRPGRRVRRQDHRAASTGRSSASASSATARIPASSSPSTC